MRLPTHAYIHYITLGRSPPTSPNKADIQSKLIAELSKATQAKTALELAHALGFPTRKSVNPTLYRMEKEGIVTMDHSAGPPRWSLSSSHHSRGGTQLGSSQQDSHHPRGGPLPGFPARRSVPSLQQDIHHHDQLVVSPEAAVTTQTMSQTGGSPSQPQTIAILKHLRSSESSCTTLDLSKVANMSRNEVTPVLNQLKSEGLIDRVSDSPPIWRITQIGLQTQLATSSGSLTSQQDLPLPTASEMVGDMQCETDGVHHSNVDSDEDMETEEPPFSGLNLDLSHIPRDNIRDRLIAVFEEDPVGLRTDLELAKEIGDYTRGQVRPFLEVLASEGRIARLSGFPAKWKALSANELTGGSHQTPSQVTYLIFTPGLLHSKFPNLTC